MNTPQTPTDAERQLRKDLAACYRLIAHFRMSDMTYTHISARLPGTEDFLLNPYGFLFEEVTASSLVKVDADGNVLSDPTGMGINRAGFVIHSAVHAARPEVGCVIHTHTTAGMAVSTHPDGLLPITQHAMRFYQRMGRHPYEGIAIDAAERERLARDLGPHKALLLENHGLLTCGETTAEAFTVMMFLERACQAQVAALSGGYPPVWPAIDAVEKTANLFASGKNVGQKAWDAMLRMLDRQDPRYAD